jgi:glycosyltransferase involved in cell wall biosynthesis
MSTFSGIDLSVIVPAFNVGKEILPVLERVRELVFPNFNYEIVVVDDGSTDNTREIVQKLQESNSHLRLISYGINKGKGYAIKVGVAQSKGINIVLLDGDSEISPNLISKYLDEIKDFDILLGSKRHPLSKVNCPTYRMFLSRGFNILVCMLTGLNSEDTQVGFKVAKGVILRRIFKDVMVNRYAYDVELLIIASILKLKVKEMPINMTIKRAFSLPAIWRMLVDLAFISYRHRIAHWYEKRQLYIKDDLSSEERGAAYTSNLRRQLRTVDSTTSAITT